MYKILKNKILATRQSSIDSFKSLARSYKESTRKVFRLGERSDNNNLDGQEGFERQDQICKEMLSEIKKKIKIK
jgi:hypothetical protein